MDRLVVWLRNSLHFHERLMAGYLRPRGWVVFYLDEEQRSCNAECWLKLYESQRRSL